MMVMLVLPNCCCHEKWASSSSFFFFSSSKSCANSPSRNQVSAGSAAALRSGTAGPHDGGGTPPGFVAHVHIPAVEHRCGRAGRWLKRMLSRCRPHPSELGVALRCLLRRRVLHYCNHFSCSTSPRQSPKCYGHSRRQRLLKGRYCLLVRID